MEMVDLRTKKRGFLFAPPANRDDMLDETKFPDPHVFLGIDVCVSGERLKEARKNAGLTQAELGKKLGVTGATVSNWEKGNTEPKVGVLRDISNILDVPVIQLLDEFTYVLAKK
jgi:DNA-binding XRE family transcriptional regulator